ncbi:MAG TPA: hypothetical protein PLF71_04320 [bacterium]|nr:MAG: hypothetical protein BWY14_01086 [Parcubacteria group bacterium ADurb.Bin192]HPN15307.1 hypothetical protein [bacterium]
MQNPFADNGQVPYTLQVASLPKAVRKQPSLRTEPLPLAQALADFGSQLVMQASDECRVLPHILHLIGKGGEHIVFEDLMFPNFVLKVNFIESLPLLHAVSRGTAAYEEALGKLKLKAEEHNKRLKILQSYFPSGSVPLELVSVKDIPLNTEVVLSVMKDRNLDIPKNLKVPASLPLLCTIQRRIDLPKDNRVNIYSSYAELNRTILPEYYVQGHDLLVDTEENPVSDRDEMEKIIAYIYPSLRFLIEKIKADQELKEILFDYVGRVIQYSLDTEEIVDMAGGGNVLFIKNQEQRWQPFLMDALSPAELNFKLLKQGALLIKHQQSVDTHTKANILNVINYLRFVNALAMLGENPARLDVPGVKDITAMQWRDGLIIEKYLDVYTPKKTKRAS